MWPIRILNFTVPRVKNDEFEYLNIGSNKIKSTLLPKEIQSLIVAEMQDRINKHCKHLQILAFCIMLFILRKLSLRYKRRD